MLGCGTDAPGRLRFIAFTLPLLEMPLGNFGFKFGWAAHFGNFLNCTFLPVFCKTPCVGGLTSMRGGAILHEQALAEFGHQSLSERVALP